MNQATIVAGIPLDHTVEDVLDALHRLSLALREGDASPVVLPVHARALGDELRAHVRANGGVRETLVRWTEPLRRAGITVLEPVIEDGRPEHVVARAAARAGAALVLAGSGRGSTVRDWLLGSSAERIVRTCAAPVWIARGTFPGPTAPVLAPVDLGPQSRLTIAAALRWARMFGAPLRVLHVIREEVDLAELEPAVARLEQTERDARAAITTMLEGLDTRGVEVDVRMPRGRIAAIVLAEAAASGLVVMVQPDWEMLVPASFGSHAERIIRTSRASVIALRDDESAPRIEAREERWRWVAELVREAREAEGAGDSARAERLLENARIAAPASPAIEEALARVLDAQGRGPEAERHRALAAWLRAAIG